VCPIKANRRPSGEGIANHIDSLPPSSSSLELPDYSGYYGNALGELTVPFTYLDVDALAGQAQTLPDISELQKYEIVIWFTQELEPSLSSIKLHDAKGNAIAAAADSAVDRSNRTMLRLPVPPLAPGKYRVVWRVLSIDSHVTAGDFTFDVAP